MQKLRSSKENSNFTVLFKFQFLFRAGKQTLWKKLPVKGLFIKLIYNSCFRNVKQTGNRKFTNQKRCNLNTISNFFSSSRSKFWSIKLRLLSTMSRWLRLSRSRRSQARISGLSHRIRKTLSQVQRECNLVKVSTAATTTTTATSETGPNSFALFSSVKPESPLFSCF